MIGSPKKNHLPIRFFTKDTFYDLKLRTADFQIEDVKGCIDREKHMWKKENKKNNLKSRDCMLGWCMSLWKETKIINAVKGLCLGFFSCCYKILKQKQLRMKGFILDYSFWDVTAEGAWSIWSPDIGDYGLRAMNAHLLVLSRVFLLYKTQVHKTIKMNNPISINVTKLISVVWPKVQFPRWFEVL